MCYQNLKLLIKECILSSWTGISLFLNEFSSSLICTFIDGVNFLNVALVSGFRLYSDFLNVGKTSTTSEKFSSLSTSSCPGRSRSFASRAFSIWALLSACWAAEMDPSAPPLMMFISSNSLFSGRVFRIDFSFWDRCSKSVLFSKLSPDFSSVSLDSTIF
jgi:hypothetical protein